MSYDHCLFLFRLFWIQLSMCLIPISVHHGPYIISLLIRFNLQVGRSNGPIVFDLEVKSEPSDHNQMVVHRPRIHQAFPFFSLLPVWVLNLRPKGFCCALPLVLISAPPFLFGFLFCFIFGLNPFHLSFLLCNPPCMLTPLPYYFILFFYCCIFIIFFILLFYFYFIYLISQKIN